MVTPNVEDLSETFENVIEEQDITGAAAIGVAGAGGGTAAQQLSGRIMPLLGFSATPSSATGLVARGAVKMLVAAAAGYLALEVGGTVGLLLGVAGLGALVVGGGDWISALLATDIGVTPSQSGIRQNGVNQQIQAAQGGSGNARSGRGTINKVSGRTTRGTDRTSAAQVEEVDLNDEDESEQAFRQTTDEQVEFRNGTPA